MKLIYNRPPACPCTEKLWAFINQYGEDRQPGVGSLVECDCGAQYTLAESQKDGRFWIKNTDSLGSFTG